MAHCERNARCVRHRPGIGALFLGLLDRVIPHMHSISGREGPRSRLSRVFILPYGLAFAAGVMLYVVFDEMIPESHRMGHEKEATFGGILGFALMMALDTVFG